MITMDPPMLQLASVRMPSLDISTLGELGSPLVTEAQPNPARMLRWGSSELIFRSFAGQTDSDALAEPLAFDVTTCVRPSNRPSPEKKKRPPPKHASDMLKPLLISGCLR